MSKQQLLRFLFIAVLLSSKANFLFAQTPSILLFTPDSSYRQSSSMVQIHGLGLFGSNAVDNRFVGKSVFGGHIDDEHLNMLYDKMKAQNRAGFMASGGIDLYNFTDTLFANPDWGLRAGFSTNYHGYLSFNRDLFKAVYRGNKSFANQSVQLGPLVGGFQAWQKFGAGIFNKKTWSSVTLSLVAGQQYQSLIVNNSELYTSMLGDSLSLSYTGDYLRSDSLRKGFANGSGLGLALDFNYNLPLADNKGVISISLQDVGFIGWNKRSQRFSYDSLTTWTGVEVNNLFQLDTDSLNLPNLRDTLNFQKETKGFTTALPASIQVRYSRYINEKNLYEVGMALWANRASVPAIYAGASHFFGPHFMLSERINYGGYGKFGIGIEAQWMPRGTWLIRAGSNNVEGFISKETFGMSGYFTLAKFFGRVEEEPVKIEN